jgi:hypothetical protein
LNVITLDAVKLVTSGLVPSNLVGGQTT